MLIAKPNKPSARFVFLFRGILLNLDGGRCEEFYPLIFLYTWYMHINFNDFNDEHTLSKYVAMDKIDSLQGSHHYNSMYALISYNQSSSPES